MTEERDSRILNANKEAERNVLNDIYNSFSAGRDKIVANEISHPIYKALHFLCEHEKIELVPFSVLLSVLGTEFTVEDAARLSHFPIRSVSLEKNWEKKDGGSFIAWLQCGGCLRPVVMIQNASGRYMYYDPEKDDALHPVESEVINNLTNDAVKIYRRFPDEKIGFWGLLKYCGHALRRKDIIMFILLMIVVTIIGILTPILTRSVYDFFIAENQIQKFISVIIILVICNLVGISMEIVKNLVYFRISSRIKYQLQEAVFDRLIHLPAGVLRTQSSADMSKRALDVETVVTLVFDAFLSSVFTLVFAIVYLIPMFSMSKALGLGAVGMTLLLILITLPVIINQRRYTIKHLEADAELASSSWKLIDGAEKIKESGAEERAVKQYMKGYIRSNELGVKILKSGQTVTLLTTSYNICSMIVFYYLAAFQNSSITTGVFMSFLAAFGIFSQSIVSFFQALSTSSAVKPAYNRLKLILETLPDYSKQGSFIKELNGRIDVDHLTFSYDGSEDVLKDICLHIEPGEYVGIVGFSGCGKSTFMRVLLGLEEPSVGDVYYDGKNLKKLDHQNLFEKMGIVLQNGKVFSGSIRENIVFTHPDATLDEIKRAVKNVGLDKDLARMPMGLETYISEGGGVVSGGQQQRILLARAIIGDPGVVFLDEATSALDNMTQNIVCTVLSKISATKIVIAHRLSTLTECSRILVMEDGRFVEDGTYSELMEKKGRFYELAQRQLL